MSYDANSLPDLLPIYYKRIFPYAPYYRWLNYGGGIFWKRRGYIYGAVKDIAMLCLSR